MPPPPPNRVRALREARGLTQLALAEAVGLTRQSLGAIEAGRSSPSVHVALRIAAAVGCRVEDLFGDEGVERVSAVAADGPAGPSGRVALAHIRGRWVALPLGGQGLRLAADGFVTGGTAARPQVESLRPLAEARDNVVVTGCAPALGLLADRLNARATPSSAGRFLWLPRSSAAALGALDRGEAHLAGVHLVDPDTGEANTADVRRLRSAEALVLVTLARWEVGLVVRPADAERVRGVADLGRRGLRVVGREEGAGAQRLLEQRLAAAGLPVALGRDAKLRATGHLEVAQAVSMGAGDAGVATRDAALAFGLHFVPLSEERYDLVIPRASLDDPRVERWLDALTSRAVRIELDALGYDVTHAGDRVAEIGAA